jgi:hypothetical protein
MELESSLPYSQAPTSKIKSLKYKMMNFNKMLIVQRNERSGFYWLDTGQARQHHQQRLHVQPPRKTFYYAVQSNILLKFIVLYFNSFILLRREKNLYVFFF